MLINSNKDRISEVKTAIGVARNDSAIVAMTNGDTTPAALLKAVATRKVSALNELLTRDTIAPGQDATLRAEAESACADYNDLMTIERLNALRELPVGEAMTAYLKDQTVKGYRVALDQKSNRYSLSDRMVTVTFYDFIAITRPLEKNGLMDAIAVFVDNVVRNDANDDGVSVSREALSSGYAAMRDRMGWTGKGKVPTKAELVEQLNQLVNKFILPSGMELKMIKPDLRYIRVAAVVATDKSNKAGGYQQRNDETLCNYIFRSVYTRNFGLAYDFQKTNAQQNDPYTYGVTAPKQDKAAEAKAEANDTPKAKAAK